jgi:hypothetical protein
MTLKTVRLDMPPDRTRWDGKYGPLSWTGYRGSHLRDVSVKLTVKRLRFLRISLKAEWHAPDALKNLDG